MRNLRDSRPDSGRRESPLRPVSLCGAAKLVTEFMLSDFEAAHGLKWAAPHYFNAAGADPSVCTGEGRFPETQLIPLVLDAASGRRKAVAVWGTDCDTPDGTCVRDYVHVGDIAIAHVKALKALCIRLRRARSLESWA
jgi:UDP-glucose 4-epimerase